MAVSALSTNSVLNICSFNMYGFNNGTPMLKCLCNRYDIILVQEHWLLSSELHKLDTVCSDFMSFKLSSMDSKASNGILTGRPFGGVAIMWRKSLSNNVALLDWDRNDGRFASIMIQNVCKKNIVLTNVYFPCLGQHRDYTLNTSSILSHIDNMLLNNVDSYHMIGGDFNFEYEPSNIGYKLFNDIVNDYNLICCDSLIKQDCVQYTYRHESLNQTSWIDHFFVSTELFNAISSCNIVEFGLNLSDHLPIDCCLNLSGLCDNFSKKGNDTASPPREKTMKERWDKADLVGYYFTTGSLLQSIVVPWQVLQCEAGCNCASHTSVINDYYESIVDALKVSALHCVPRTSHSNSKPYWCDRLDELKAISIDMYDLWKLVGRPRQGVINAARLKAKREFKLAIKQAAVDFERANADELYQHLSDKESRKFWKSWNTKYNNGHCENKSIGGHSNPSVVADLFKDHYSKVFVNSNQDSKAVDEFKSIYCNTYNKDALDRDKSEDLFVGNLIDVECIERCVKLLKLNKAAGHDELVAEHVIHSHPAIILLLKLLFSMMLLHAYVPEAFGRGIIIPIVKDRLSDLTSVDNYRPITLSPIISKIFESVLLDKFEKYMRTDDLQFGFKKGLGCANAIFALRQVINYYTSHNSNVYIASLDASKAFDRVNHFKLYTVLIRAGLPKCFVDVVINWYHKLLVVVRWDGFDSSTLKVLSGVRQGGILSPILFNMYANCFLTTLRQSKRGCHIGNTFLGCIMYADDLLLISASVVGLQGMLNKCEVVGFELGINFNGMKSNCMQLGPNSNLRLAPMHVGNVEIKWTTSLKYLGIKIVSDKMFKVDMNDTRRKFYASVNSILNKCKYASDFVKLHLMESQCLPVITYCIESLCLDSSQMKEINSWWNSVYRKIFGFNKWESVKELIYFLDRIDLHHLINLRRALFVKRLAASKNSVVVALFNYYTCHSESKSLEESCGFKLWWPVYKIKSAIHQSFKTAVLERNNRSMN